MTDLPADDKDGLRSARGRPDSWLVGTLVVLLGLAVSAAMPQIAGAVRAAVVDAAKPATGSRDAAQRPSVRLAFIGVRVVEPKISGGHDLFVQAPHGEAPAVSLGNIFARPIDLAAHVRERGINARAPPRRA